MPFPAPPWGAAVLLSVVATGGCAKPSTHLQLDEVSALTVPDSVGIAGVSTGPAGEVLLWTPTQDRVVVIRGTERRDLADSALVRPVAAAVVDASTASAAVPVRGIEVLAGGSGSLLRFTADGRRVHVRPLPRWKGAVAGQRARTGWFALVPDGTSGQGYALQFQADTAREPRVVYSIPADRAGKARAVRLAPWGDSLIVTEAGTPYRSVVVPANGAPVRPLLDPGHVAPLRETRYNWISMPVVPVGSRFLQEFADAGSDHRLFVLYGEGREPLRTAFVDAPIAIVGGRVDPDYLVGMRRVGRTEVVRYRWRWTE